MPRADDPEKTDAHRTDASGALSLIAPEGDLTTNYVEVKGDTGRHAITAAWQKVRPGFDLAEMRSDEYPGHNGWDTVAQIEYVTPAIEQRYVLAVALAAVGFAGRYRVHPG